MKTIFDIAYEFNRKTAPGTWEPNKDYVLLFVNSTSQFLNDTLKVKGYLSVEQICNTFGIEVTPEIIESVSVYRYCGKRITFTLAPDPGSKGYYIVCAEV